MGSDSIANDAVPSFFKDIGRKKRTNRLAKLKQSKVDVRREQWLSQVPSSLRSNDHPPSVHSLLTTNTSRRKHTASLAKLKQSKVDVRREQWLSQVKNNGTKVASNGWGGSTPRFSLVTDEGNKLIKSSESGSKEVDIEGSSIHESEVDSLMSSPVGSSNLPGSSCSSASSRCYSGSVSETEGDDDCLDDWEALADAFTAKEMHNDPKCEPPTGSVNKTCLAIPELSNKSSDISLLVKDSKGIISGAHENCQAWHADDASRPQSLPNLLKQNNPNMKSSRGVTSWAWQNIVSQPSSCPICYEDLDITDSSFLPCPCGFRLCLFCHNRILEADARCPGCRKQYDHIKGDLGFTGGDGFVQIGLSA